MERVAFVTQHGKERLARPLLGVRGLELVHVERDTDQLGTFTGLVERRAGALDTARVKARWGFEAAPTARFALASEGSFSPHPAAPHVTLAHELVLLVDARTGREFVGADVSFDSTFARGAVGSLHEARAFAEQARFPSHGLFVQRQPVDDARTLEALVGAALGVDGVASLESDLRAHRNPTRQLAISRAVVDCLARAHRECPACRHRFCITTELERGLACAWCRAPTRGVRLERQRCLDCGHQEEAPCGPLADPATCDACNP